MIYSYAIYLPSVERTGIYGYVLLREVGYVPLSLLQGTDIDQYQEVAEE